MLAAKSKRSRFSQETGTDGNSKPTPGPLILFESKLDVKFGAGRNSGPVCYGRARITVNLKCYRDAKRQQNHGALPAGGVSLYLPRSIRRQVINLCLCLKRDSGSDVISATFLQS